VLTVQLSGSQEELSISEGERDSLADVLKIISVLSTWLDILSATFCCSLVNMCTSRFRRHRRCKLARVCIFSSQKLLHVV
jgi:hypothetical protein